MTLNFKKSKKQTQVFPILHDLGKNVTRSSDVDKYSFKRINCQPLQDRQENLDHTSYPQIFPQGCGNIIYFKYENINLIKSIF